MKNQSKTEEITLFPLDKMEIIKVQNQKSIDKLNSKILELELVNEMINNLHARRKIRLLRTRSRRKHSI